MGLHLPPPHHQGELSCLRSQLGAEGPGAGPYSADASQLFRGKEAYIREYRHPNPDAAIPSESQAALSM